MASVIVPAAIGAGASIVSGLTGKHAAKQAQQAQTKANDQAIALQRQQLADQEAQQNYANRQAAAVRQRNMTLGNALLRSMGATGLKDPSVDYEAFSMAAPMIGPMGAPKVAPRAPVVPPRPPLTLADLVGGPAPPPPPPQMSPNAGTLGTMFRRPSQSARYEEP